MLFGHRRLDLLDLTDLRREERELVVHRDATKLPVPVPGDGCSDRRISKVVQQGDFQFSIFVASSRDAEILHAGVERDGGRGIFCLKFGGK